MMMVREQRTDREETLSREQQMYKKLFEKAYEAAQNDNSLTSQIMDISTEQIRIGNELKTAAKLVNEGHRIEATSAKDLAVMAYRYVEDMKFDFVVGYCDELWRDLRKGLVNFGDMSDHGQDVHEVNRQVEAIRWQMVAVKDTLRQGEDWDSNGIRAFLKLKQMMEDLDREMEYCHIRFMDESRRRSYLELAEFFVDAYFVGLQLKLRVTEVMALCQKHSRRSVA